MGDMTNDITKAMDRGIAVDRYPWERQPREGERAFAAYLIYRDQKPPRVMHRVASQLGRSLALIHRWSSAWNWLERTAQWDNYRLMQRDDDSIEAINEMNDRHAKLAKAMSGKIAQRLQTLQPDELSPGEIGRWMQVVSMVERLSRGEATERVDRGASDNVQVNVGVAVTPGGDVPSFDRDHIGEIMDRLAARGIVPAGPIVDVGPAGPDDTPEDEVRPDPDESSTGDVPAGTP